METHTAEAPAAAAHSSAKGDARRHSLVESTISLASRNGVVATSVKDIAQAAGVAPGLVHYYYESKEELLIGVVDRLDAELEEVWRTAAPDASDPLERLVVGLYRIADHADSHPQLRRLLSDLALLSLSSPALHERCTAMWTRINHEIENELRQVLGQLPAYSLASPHDIAAVISGAIDGIMLQAMVCNTAPLSALRTVVTMVLSMVVTAYVVVGQSPPLARLRELSQR